MVHAKHKSPTMRESGGLLQVPLPAMPRKQPKQARSIAMVEALKSTAREIVEAEGIDALSLIRLSECSGVAVSSIYEYFPTLDAVISEIFEDYRVEMSGNLIQAIEALPGTATLFDGVGVVLRAGLAFRHRQLKMAPGFSTTYLHYIEFQRLELVESGRAPAGNSIRFLQQRFADEACQENKELVCFLAINTVMALTRSLALARPDDLINSQALDAITRSVHALLKCPDA